MPPLLDRLPRCRIARRAGAPLFRGGGGEAEILEPDTEARLPCARPVLDEGQRREGAARVAIGVEEGFFAARPAGELLAHVDRCGGAGDQGGFVDTEQAMEGRKVGRRDQRGVRRGHLAGVDPDDIGAEPGEGTAGCERRHRRGNAAAMDDDLLHRVRHGTGAGQ